jgi:trans-2,3-dihydro-3-hydroxyanthranilate isomerase
MSARQYRFVTCDVFTDRRFGGNPLAVLPDARGLSGDEMQKIATEFNYSESTFVLPPQDPKHTAQVRIFTPVRELPFAGHPTVGTAFALAALGIVPAAVRDIVFEEGVGPVPVRIDRDGSRVTRCTLTAAQLPQQLPPAPARATLAEMLSLAPADVLDGAEGWSCGLPFIVVPLAHLDAMHRCRPAGSVILRALADHPAKAVYPVTREADGVWRVRSFVPHAGVAEDPATGSAAAAFAGWVHARSPAGDGTLRLRLNQGVEMGRPSELALEIDRAGGQITAVRVGGASVMVSEGKIQLD